jgi:hypothetical protein
VSTAFRWIAAIAVIATSLCGCRGCVDDPGAMPSSNSSPPFAEPSAPRLTEGRGLRRRGLERIMAIDGGAQGAPLPREVTSSAP